MQPILFPLWLSGRGQPLGYYGKLHIKEEGDAVWFGLWIITQKTAAWPNYAPLKPIFIIYF